jgi:ribosomal protein S18 acetylase RimI-like enzyme
MIRIATSTDGEAINHIAATASVFLREEVECVAELWEEYQKNGAVVSGYYFIVLEEAGDILGFACYGPRALTHGTFDLYWIAVDSNKKRKGAGRLLMAQAEKNIAALGGRLVIVETSGKLEYAPTRSFYERIGYLKEAVLKDFYADGDDLVIFTKKVSAEHP